MVLKRGVLIMRQFILDCYPPPNQQLPVGPSRLQVLEFYNGGKKCSAYDFYHLSLVTLMSIKMYNYIFYCRSVLFSIYCWFLNPSAGNNDYVKQATEFDNIV